MRRAIRSQVDELQDTYSLASGLDCSWAEDMTRQEFKDETDVNYLLARFGVDTPVQRNPQYGDNDFDLDLHSAYISVDRAQQALMELPQPLREKFPTTKALLDAVHTGEFTEALRAHQALEKAPPDPEPSPTPPVEPNPA